MVDISKIYVVFLIIVVIDLGILASFVEKAHKQLQINDVELLHTILFEITEFFSARYVSFFAITRVFFGDSYESLFVYIFFKIDLIVTLIITVIWVYFNYFIIGYILTNCLEVSIIIYFYNIIIRKVLYRYYRLFGSNVHLHAAYNVS